MLHNSKSKSTGRAHVVPFVLVQDENGEQSSLDTGQNRIRSHSTGEKPHLGLILTPEVGRKKSTGLHPKYGHQTLTPEQTRKKSTGLHPTDGFTPHVHFLSGPWPMKKASSEGTVRGGQSGTPPPPATPSDVRLGGALAFTYNSWRKTSTAQNPFEDASKRGTNLKVTPTDWVRKPSTSLRPRKPKVSPGETKVELTHPKLSPDSTDSDLLTAKSSPGNSRRVLRSFAQVAHQVQNLAKTSKYFGEFFNNFTTLG